jgi:hypothetical protein
MRLVAYFVWGVESGGGVCEAVRKLCEFVEDEWELVRHVGIS